MAFEPVQLFSGSVLFLFTAYALERALLDGGAEWPERAAIGLSLAFLVPGLLLLLLNLGLRLPINTTTVYLAYLGVGAVSLARVKWAGLFSKGLA